MAGNIPPPLVSSSPPPLSAFDDDDEDDDDEFGIFAAAEDIEFHDVSFKEKEITRQSNNKSGGEQDSTSQDSATDSGLCPDSEGVSPSPQSDDEKIAKSMVYGDQLFDHSEESPSLTLCPNSNPSLTLCPNSNTLQDTQSDSTSTLYSQSNCDKHSSAIEDALEHMSLSSLPQVLNNNIDATSKDTRSGKCEHSQENHFYFNDSEENCDQFNKIENCIVEDTGFNVVSNKQVSQESEDFETADIAFNVVSHNHLSQESEDSKAADTSFNVVSHNQFSQEPEDFETAETGCNIGSINQLSQESVDSTAEEDSKEDYLSTTNSNLENDVQNVDKGPNLELNEEEDDDDFDDFCDFQATFPTPTFSSCEINESIEFKETEPTLPPKLNNLDGTVEPLNLFQDGSDDEFSNFADFTSSECAFVSAPSTSFQNNFWVAPSDTELRTESDFQDWASVFPEVPSEPQAFSKGDLVSDRDGVWSRLIPLDVTPALSYQWTNSLAYRRLLTSLNIDSRNILMMPWSNLGVPRFAATLSGGPLEPIKAVEPLQPTPAPAPAPVPAPPATVPATSNSLNPATVPDAHFDWVSSGLTNPLDCSHSSLLDLDFMMSLSTHLTISARPVLNPHKTLSAEAERVLNSLPDLSFMRKTYIDFPINKG